MLPYHLIYLFVKNTQKQSFFSFFFSFFFFSSFCFVLGGGVFFFFCFLFFLLIIRCQNPWTFQQNEKLKIPQPCMTGYMHASCMFYTQTVPANIQASRQDFRQSFTQVWLPVLLTRTSQQAHM